MKTNVLVVLDKRKAQSDGRYALLLRIIHGSTSAQISLKKYFFLKDWDDKARLVKTSYRGTESILRLNNWIGAKKAELVDFITKLDEKKVLRTLTSAQQIKELFEHGAENASFTRHTLELIEKLIEAGRIGNARSYKSMLTALQTFTGKENILFVEVNYQLLLKMEVSHLKKGNSPNGLAVIMRTIKAVYNQGIKEGMVEPDTYPFTNYKIKTIKTQKRAISIDSIRKIEQIELDQEHPLYHTRLTFLFCFYMRGLPYADMARLKLANITDGRIYYQRQKTDKPYNIKVTQEIQSILDVYITGKLKEDYIFNIVKRTTEVEIYKDIEWARARYNEKLKELGKLCGIQENLTTYVARHSYATIAKNLNVPIAVISDMLGHSSTKTTEIYLDSLPSDLLDKEHERIIRSTNKNEHK